MLKNLLYKVFSGHVDSVSTCSRISEHTDQVDWLSVYFWKISCDSHIWDDRNAATLWMVTNYRHKPFGSIPTIRTEDLAGCPQNTCSESRDSSDSRKRIRKDKRRKEIKDHQAYHQDSSFASARHENHRDDVGIVARGRERTNDLNQRCPESQSDQLFT